MFNICARSVWRCQPFKHTYKMLGLQNYATFNVRDILYETSDETGTLHTRFAKHVALERQKICDQVPSSVRYPDYFPITDVTYFQKELKKTDKEQLANVITFAFTYRSNADPNKFAVILNELDRHAVNNVKEMSADTILRTLYAFLFLMPNWMTRLDFYGQAMQRLHAEFSKQDHQTKEMLLQLCFYMGLSKKETKLSVNNLLESLLNEHLDKHINEMTTLDMALVSNAAYKTSVVIKSEVFNERLLSEVLSISDTTNGNDGLFINFIKSMRLQRVRSSKVCEYLENICQDPEKLQQFQIRGQVHLLAYLAENLWDSEVCLKALRETITGQLRISHKNSQIIRGKDISTFLWACAQLNCKLSSIQFENIEKSLLDKINAGEFKYFADQLLGSCLYLWVLGYKSKELLQAAIQVKSDFTKKRKEPKVDSRLTVLLSAAQIEEPIWCSRILKDFQAFNLTAEVPPHLTIDENYNKIIDELLKEEIVSSANISCPINGINILGIHVKLSTSPESQVFVELMTPSQTLRFSQEAVAIFRLKLRLLQSLGHKVAVLSLTDALNPEILRNALKNCNLPQEDVKEPSKSIISA